MSETSGPHNPSKSFLALTKDNRSGVWTTIGGGVLIFVIWQLALVLVTLYVPVVQTVVLGGKSVSPGEEAVGIGFLLVGGFGPAFIVMMLWRRMMERRRVLTLFTAVGRFRWSLAVVSAVVVGAMGLGLTVAFDPESVALMQDRLTRLSPSDWLMLTIAYGIGISVQATFEEAYVRGWLLQHISRFIPNAMAAIVTTALIFSALHYGHPGWATYVAALTFGLAYGWSAWRLNGLEAAIGAHVANNLIGALLTGQMVSGNPPTMDGADFALYAAYVLGFLLFVEVWARLVEKPSRA